MAEDSAYKRCEDDDPHRCQWVIASRGQCKLLAVLREDGSWSKYCPAHDRGVKAKTELRTYALGRWQKDAVHFADDDKLKSIREEIGILRVIIQERMRACKTENDLVIFSGPISDLLMKAEKLVSSCNRIENQLGLTMDKKQAIQFAQEVMEVIGRVVEDPDQLEEIANGISAVIARPAVPAGSGKPDRVRGD